MCTFLHDTVGTVALVLRGAGVVGAAAVVAVAVGVVG